MNKWIKITVIISMMVLILTACVQGETSNSNASSTGKTKEFTIEATSFEFDITVMKVKQGDKVKINLKNKKGYHGIKIEGYNKEVRPNRSISFVAKEKGEFEYKCAAYCGAGHNKMVGKLIVQ
ncbi:cupredoxin domain-containing protein [Paenibacillus sp. CMAA1364]